MIWLLDIFIFVINRKSSSYCLIRLGTILNRVKLEEIDQLTDWLR